MEYGPTRCPSCWAALAPDIGDRCPFCRASLLSAKQQRELRKEQRRRGRTANRPVTVGAPGAAPAPPIRPEPAYYESPFAAPPVPEAPTGWPTGEAAPWPAPLPEDRVASADTVAWPAPATAWPPMTPDASRSTWMHRGLAIALATCLAVGASALGWTEVRPSAPRYPSAWDSRVTDLVSFVAKERGLSFKHPVFIDFLPDSAFRTEVTTGDGEMTSKDRDEVEQTAGMFRSLGLIGGDVNLLDAMNKLHGESTLAFYSPVTKRVRVRGAELTLMVRATLVHELTHALQDQNFDLGREGSFPDDAQNETFRPVVEGDATHVQHAWLKSLSEADQDAYWKAYDSVGQSMDLTGVPPAVSHFFGAPYNFGEPFVDLLVASGGEKAVDAALQEPPKSQAELLDPFRYLDHSSPVRVSEPSVAAGDKKADSGSFGAIALYIVLAQALEPTRALAAVDAWGGDAYVQYDHDGRTCMKISLAGRDAAATALIADSLSAWAGKMPAGAATITRQDGLVDLVACDPGKAAIIPATGDLDLAMALAVTRTQVALSFVTDDPTRAPSQARCVADRFMTALSASELKTFLTGDPDKVPKKSTDRAAAAGRSCTADRSQ